MPRGVYDRSKSKAKKAAAPAAEPKKAKAAPAQTKGMKTAPTEGRAELERQVTSIPAIDASYGFNILGAGISTLTDAYTQVKENHELASLISAELTETVRTLTALRCATFGDLVKTETPAQETTQEEVEVPEAAVPPAPAPVATLPSLPQPSAASAPVLPGNAAPFQPPAPPLPHH